MKPIYPFVVILVVSVSALVIADTLTGGIVINDKDPCRMIRCNVQPFGFIQQKAEWIGTTPNGMAICHCPQESIDYLFYVDIKPRR